MKTAVSIPDDVFTETDRLARRTKRSRSEIVSTALAEYLARHTPDQVTEGMDAVIAEVSGERDRFATAAGQRILGKLEW